MKLYQIHLLQLKDPWTDGVNPWTLDSGRNFFLNTYIQKYTCTRIVVERLLSFKNNISDLSEFSMNITARVNHEMLDKRMYH